MTDNGRDSHLGYLIPVLLFVLFFAVSTGILAGVFMRAEGVSTRAKALNDGVQLCRNGAEAFRAWEELPAIQYYGGDLREAEPDTAQYYVTLETTSEPTAAGELQTACIRASTRGGEELYTLQVTRYCPKER